MWLRNLSEKLRLVRYDERGPRLVRVGEIFAIGAAMIPPKWRNLVAEVTDVVAAGRDIAKGERDRDGDREEGVEVRNPARDGGPVRQPPPSTDAPPSTRRDGKGGR